MVYRAYIIGQKILYFKPWNVPLLQNKHTHLHYGLARTNRNTYSHKKNDSDKRHHR